MKDYEMIDLNEYVQTGEGGTALSYTHKTRNVLAKLFNPGFESEKAIGEYKTACAVYESGIPTPKPIRLVTDGERYGAEYELIKNKRSFTRIVSEEPERLEELSKSFALLARDLHSKKADTSRFDSYRDRVRQFYIEKDLVPQNFKERALAVLERLPDTQTCVHGDLHMGNIITDGERTLWIDTGGFGYGAPQWDLGVLWTMCHRMNPDKALELMHITSETLARHWDIFLPAYLGTDDKEKLEQFTKSMFPFYALKVPYVYDMALHTSMPAAKIEFLIKMIGG